MTPTPVPASEKSLAARIAAQESWARTTDRSARTQPARAALFQKFLDQVDGDEVRAQHLWKAHFARLALKSAQARRQVREQLDVVEATSAEFDSLSGDKGTVRDGGEHA